MDDIVDDLPFTRFDELTRTITELKREEDKARITEFAFLAFQLGAGGTKTFGEYLNELGLGDGQVPKEQTISPQALATLKSLAKETEQRTKKKGGP